MRTVNVFEADLLRVLHCLMRRGSLERARKVVAQTHRPPKCLGRDAVALVQDALAKGTVTVTAREGGWRRERFLRGEADRGGRLWERTQPAGLALTFSPASLRFLIDLTALTPEAREFAAQPRREWTLGDRWLHFRAYDALRRTPEGHAMRSWPLVRENTLVRLVHFRDFDEKPPAGAAKYTKWLQDAAGVGILEGLQPRLAQVWSQAEIDKRTAVDRDRLFRLSEFQTRTLTELLDALEKAGRRDLARFLLAAFAQILPDDATAHERWLGSVNVAGLRLADRMEFYRTALGTFRLAERLAQWNQWARSVGFYDEGYQAAQLWKLDWERLDGDAVCARARLVVRQADLMGEVAAGGNQAGGNQPAGE